MIIVSLAILGLDIMSWSHSWPASSQGNTVGATPGRL